MDLSNNEWSSMDESKFNEFRRLLTDRNTLNSPENFNRVMQGLRTIPKELLVAANIQMPRYKSGRRLPGYQQGNILDAFLQYLWEYVGADNADIANRSFHIERRFAPGILSRLQQIVHIFRERGVTPKNCTYDHQVQYDYLKDVAHRANIFAELLHDCPKQVASKTIVDSGVMRHYLYGPQGLMARMWNPVKAEPYLKRKWEEESEPIAKRLKSLGGRKTRRTKRKSGRRNITGKSRSWKKY